MKDLEYKFAPGDTVSFVFKNKIVDGIIYEQTHVVIEGPFDVHFFPRYIATIPSNTTLQYDLHLGVNLLTETELLVRRAILTEKAK